MEEKPAIHDFDTMSLYKVKNKTDCLLCKVKFCIFAPLFKNKKNE